MKLGKLVVIEIIWLLAGLIYFYGSQTTQRILDEVIDESESQIDKNDLKFYLSIIVIFGWPYFLILNIGIAITDLFRT